MSKVLDHGEVTLLGVLGSDISVVGAARVSTGYDPSVASKGGHADSKLIQYLMRNGHGTPFEHAVFQWYVKAPIFVVREWQRHRIASYNEFSGRYAEMRSEFYTPPHVRVPHPENKQQSVIHDQTDWLASSPRDIAHHAEVSLEIYKLLLDRGVAREMARMVLPLNIYTRFWFTINARSLMNFLMLRNADDAMWEIREYACALELDFKYAMPFTHRAFEEHGRRAP